MASPLDEAVKDFVENVFSNETLTQDERKQFILSSMLSLENKITDGKHRWGMSMALSSVGKIAKSEARIDWSQSAVDIWRQIRAFSPSPGATGRYHDTELKICKAHPAPDRTGDPGQVLQADPEGGLLVACGSGGALWLDQLQKPGGKKLSSSEFLRGFRMTGGESFTW